MALTHADLPERISDRLGVISSEPCGHDLDTGPIILRHGEAPGG